MRGRVAAAGLDRRTAVVMAAACGVAVANVYFPQALTTVIARGLDVSGSSAALVATALAGDSPTTPAAVLSTIDRFADAGVDELVFTATTADSIDSLDGLAEVVANR